MKGVLIHAGLALAGLSLAYSTWTREEEVEEAAPGRVAIVDCAPEQMTSVVLQTPTNEFTVTPQKRGDETLYWVVNQAIPPAPKDPTEPTEAEKNAAPLRAVADPGVADAGVADAGAAQAAPKPVEKPKPLPKPVRFLAKAAYVEYLGKVAPLHAVRALGVIDKERFEDFGFDKVGTYLRLTCGDKTTELEIGSRTYGTAKRYARNPANGEAYLVDKALVQDLKSARYKFMQTDLHGFGLNDVDEAVVSADGMSRTLVHRNRQFDKDAHWVDSASPDQRNQLFSNWFSRVKRLKVREYLPDGAAPGSELDREKGEPGEVQPAVTIAYAVEGKARGQLELASVVQGAQTHYYAKTEATHNWVLVYNSAGKQVAEDAREVVGGEAPAPLAAETPEADSPAATTPQAAAGRTPAGPAAATTPPAAAAAPAKTPPVAAPAPATNTP